MKYHGLLSDFDGTIHKQNQMVSPSVTRAIQGLNQRQIPFGLCTGRQFGYLKSYLVSNGIIGAHIVCGGAQLVDTEGHSLREEPIPAEITHKVMEIVSKVDGCLVLKQAKVSYGNELGLRIYHDAAGIELRPISELPNGQTLAFYISRINDETLAQLTAMPEITPIKQRYRSGEPGFFVDVTAAGVSKRSGARWWCEYHELDPDCVIGVGDAENDLELFQSVGLKLAMGNAVPELKAAADVVIPALSADGVAWAIEQYLA